MIELPYPAQVREILKTYNLSPKKEKIIFRIATKLIDDLYIYDFDGIYEIIDHLVDRFHCSWERRIPISLDDIIDNSEATLSSVIGVDDKNPEDLEEKKEVITAEGAINILDGHLRYRPFHAVKQLIESSRNREINLPVSRDKIIEDKENIEKKIEEIAERFERNGQLFIPRRTIVSVEFDPLKIKFNQRHYNGNPLAFFRKHEETYRGISRTQLSRLDSGLYWALSNAEQLDDAIPQVLKRVNRLSKDKIDEILNAYDIYDGKATLAAHNLEVCEYSILKYWRRAKLKIRKRGNHGLPEKMIDKIINAHSTCKGSPTHAARELRISIPSIYRYWKASELEARKKDLSENEVNEIIAAYQTYNGSAERVSKLLGHSSRTVLKYWRASNLEIRKPGHHG